MDQQNTTNSSANIPRIALLDSHDTSLTVRYLKDILNDEDYDEYHSYSNIEISQLVSLGNSASPQPVYNFTPS